MILTPRAYLILPNQTDWPVEFKTNLSSRLGMYWQGAQNWMQVNTGLKWATTPLTTYPHPTVTAHDIWQETNKPAGNVPALVLPGLAFTHTDPTLIICPFAGAYAGGTQAGAEPYPWGFVGDAAIGPLLPPSDRDKWFRHREGLPIDDVRMSKNGAVGTWVHELGHGLGLDHPSRTEALVNNIMSQHWDMDLTDSSKSGYIRRHRKELRQRYENAATGQWVPRGNLQRLIDWGLEFISRRP